MPLISRYGETSILKITRNFLELTLEIPSNGKTLDLPINTDKDTYIRIENEAEINIFHLGESLSPSENVKG